MDIEITYLHKGRERVAIIYADDYRDAYEALESLKRTAVLGDEIVAIIPLEYGESDGND